MIYSNVLHEQTVVDQLFRAAKTVEECGVKVLRRKVERVIFDDRSSQVKCDLGCCQATVGDAK